MPRAHEIYFLFRSYKASKTDMTAWLESLIQQRSNDYARKKLKKVCHLIIKGAQEQRDAPECGYSYRTPRTSFTDALLGTVMQASVHLKDSVLCRRAVCLVQENLPRKAIVQAIQQFGLPAIQRE